MKLSFKGFINEDTASTVKGLTSPTYTDSNPSNEGEHKAQAEYHFKKREHHQNIQYKAKPASQDWTKHENLARKHGEAGAAHSWAVSGFKLNSPHKKRWSNEANSLTKAIGVTAELNEDMASTIKGLASPTYDVLRLTGKDSKGLDNPLVLQALNSSLAKATSLPFITPYLAIGAVSRVLAYANIIFPQALVLNKSQGSCTFPAEQFGKISGVNLDGSKAEEAPRSKYSVYFSYGMDEGGFYDVFAKIVDSDELDLLAGDDEDLQVGDLSSLNSKDEITEGYPTRKHFKQVADIISKIQDPKERENQAKHHAAIFKSQNSRFDHNRFYQAAGVGHLHEEPLDENRAFSWKKYHENEDENKHTENTLLLAKHAGTKEEINLAQHHLDALKKRGHQPFHSENTALHLKLLRRLRK